MLVRNSGPARQQARRKRELAGAARRRALNAMSGHRALAGWHHRALAFVPPPTQTRAPAVPGPRLLANLTNALRILLGVAAGLLFHHLKRPAAASGPRKTSCLCPGPGTSTVAGRLLPGDDAATGQLTIYKPSRTYEPWLRTVVGRREKGYRCVQTRSAEIGSYHPDWKGDLASDGDKASRAENSTTLPLGTLAGK